MLQEDETFFKNNKLFSRVILKIIKKSNKNSFFCKGTVPKHKSQSSKNDMLMNIS